MAAAPESKATAGPADLASVLRALPAGGHDTLYQALAAAGCVAPARLACSALRKALEGSVRSVHLQLRVTAGEDTEEEEEEVEEEGEEDGQEKQKTAVVSLAPLGAWPRCSKVHVTVHAAGGSAAAIVPPFQLPARLATAKRITHVTLCNNVDDPPEDAEQAVAQLVKLVPSLRVLDLERWEMTYDEGKNQAAMYEALASAPQLEELVVPGTRSLEHVGPLAASGSFRRLHVANYHIRTEQDFTLSDDDIEAICKLRGLQEMRLDVYGPTEEFGGVVNVWMLPPLLAALPPSVQLLTIDRAFVEVNNVAEFDDNFPAVRAWLDGGRLRSVQIGGQGSDVASAAALAAIADMLLDCPAMPDRLQSFAFLDAGLASFNCALLEPEEVARVHELLQRCDTFSWSLRLGSYSGPHQKDAALQLLDLLGMPESLWFETPSSGISVNTAKVPPFLHVPLLGNAQAGGNASAPLSELLLPFEVLMHAALRRLTADAAAGSSSSGSGKGAAEAARAANVPHLLLLAGPWVEKHSRDRTKLATWLRKLGSTGKGGSKTGRLAYKAVPHAGTLLVACRSAAAASVAAGAALKVAGVEAASVCPRPLKRSLEFTLTEALVQELQESWAPGFARSPRSEWPQHVEWLLTSLKAVEDLPGGRV